MHTKRTRMYFVLFCLPLEKLMLILRYLCFWAEKVAW